MKVHTYKKDKLSKCFFENIKVQKTLPKTEAGMSKSNTLNAL